MKYHVYISNSGSNFFSKFLMDSETGDLDQQQDIALGAAPGAVATNSDGTRMFVVLRNEKTYQSYRIDRSSGELSPVNKVSVRDGAPYLKVDNTDRFLLAAYYRAGAVSVHAIGQDGSISEQPLQWIETEEHAHSIQLDRSNKFAYVPHTNPANAIYQFCFDEKSGKLSPNSPHKIQPSTEEGPRHFVFHPTKDVLYTVNENGSTVSAHVFNAQNGQLSSMQVVSTLPPDYSGKDNTTAEIRISRDGRYLYASNRGHDSLAIFSVNENGRLERNGHQATEAIPRYFDFDPSGKFVLTVGQGSGRLATYRIDPEGGSLEPMASREVGDSPLWIQFVPKD